MMVQRFEGMSVVVSGAGSGLGRDIAQAFAREGARRVVLVDIDQGGLQETAKEVGDAAVVCRCDVTNAQAVEHAWQSFDDGQGLDVLVTAAGTIGSGSPIETCSVEEWDAIFAVNVKGTFLMVQQALPRLRMRKGTIVTIGSTAGLIGSKALGPYSASKGAITTLTRSLAVAHGPEQIRVNAVCPGSIETPMLEATFQAAGDAAAQQARRQAYLARYPLGRFGVPHEVTDAVLFLASPQASYLTGVCLPVDGGVLA